MTQNKTRIVFGGLIVAAIIIAIYFYRTNPYIIKNLIAYIQESGSIGIFIYICLHILAPVFFLPALPLTMSAGLLFGAFWGTVYASIGLTLGAAASFLVSRYLFADYFKKKIHNKTINKINQKIAVNGWQAVIVTRVLLLMPSIILNYTFGITDIRFLHYLLSTLVSMIIISLTFTMFSSGLSDLVDGRISFQLIAGIAILVIFNLFVKFYKQKKGGDNLKG